MKIAAFSEKNKINWLLLQVVRVPTLPANKFGRYAKGDRSF
jgi:hypothetical protein